MRSIDKRIYKALLKTECFEKETTKTTRLEVIDSTGRAYMNNNCEFELDYQDEGRTLKIFIK